jgi:hypothetical protein
LQEVQDGGKGFQYACYPKEGALQEVWKQGSEAYQEEVSNPQVL